MTSNTKNEYKADLDVLFMDFQQAFDFLFYLFYYLLLQFFLVLSFRPPPRLSSSTGEYLNKNSLFYLYVIRDSSYFKNKVVARFI